jgi:outer membrane protein assembly factor BamB
MDDLEVPGVAGIAMNRSRTDWRRLIVVLVVVPALGASQGCTGGEAASPWSFDAPPDGGADAPRPRLDAGAESDSSPADSGVPDPHPVECDPPTDEPAWRTSNATPASTRRGRCAGPADPEQAWSIRLWEGPSGEWRDASRIGRVVDSAVVDSSGTIIVALGPIRTADDAWQTELRAVGPTGDPLWEKTFPLAERPSSGEPSELLRGSSSLSLLGAGELAYAVDGRLRVVDTADGRVIQDIELPGAPGPSTETAEYSREGPMISTSDGRLLVGRRLYSHSPPDSEAFSGRQVRPLVASVDRHGGEGSVVWRGVWSARSNGLDSRMLGWSGNEPGFTVRRNTDDQTWKVSALSPGSAGGMTARWTVPRRSLFSPPKIRLLAASGDTVYYSALEQDRTSAITAVDRQSGRMRWSEDQETLTELRGPASPQIDQTVVTADGRLVFGFERVVFGVAPDGRHRWSHDPADNSGRPDALTLAAGRDGRTYAGSIPDERSITAFDPDGDVLWQHSFADRWDDARVLAVGKGRTLFATTMQIKTDTEPPTVVSRLHALR